MTGGLLQLVAYGSQDIYLTGNPEITYFKLIYRRHTQFSLETKELQFDNKVKFGNESSIIIKRYGDIITRTYLKITINPIIPSNNSLMAWINLLGGYMIEYLDLDIGGTRINRLYSDWIIIWYSLISYGNQRKVYNIFSGNIPQLTTYNNNPKPEYTMYIPIPFWFNINKSFGLPIINLQYHEIQIKIKLKNNNEVIVANDFFIKNDLEQVKIKNLSLLVEYAYLDSEERRKLAQTGIEYIMEDIEFNGIDIVKNNNIININFNNPTKVLLWFIKNDNYISGKKFVYYTNQNWNNKLIDASLKILQESVLLITDNFNKYIYTDIFKPKSFGYTKNNNIYVENKSNSYLIINTNSLKSKYSITNKICANIYVNEFINIDIIKTNITIKDLSIPLEYLIDTRYIKNDPYVYIYNNYGLLINGQFNPIKKAKLTVNGIDRIDFKDGNYFNYVQPYQSYPSIPFDGINIYSFSLEPFKLQPTGSINLSRIDSFNLIFYIRNILKIPNLLNNKLSIYGVNYNILRIISGMAGKAFN